MLLSAVLRDIALRSKQRMRSTYDANPLQHITVADRLPHLADCEFRTISTQEFQREEGIVYTESTHVLENKFYQLWSDYGHIYTDDFVSKAMYERPPVVVVNMGEAMGKGLFLSQDATPIKAGCIVWPSYGGVALDEFDPSGSKEYNFNPLTSYNQQSQTVLDDTGLKQLDAAKYRGLGGYLQFALTSHLLKDYQIDETIKPYIFTANLVQATYIIENCPVVFFVALRDIQPGEPLCYPYCSDYPETHPETTFYVMNGLGEPIGEIRDKTITAIQGAHLGQPLDLVEKTDYFVFKNTDVPDYRALCTRGLTHFFTEEYKYFPSMSLQGQVIRACCYLFQKQQPLDSIIDALQAYKEVLKTRFYTHRQKPGQLKKNFGHYFDEPWMAYFITRLNYYLWNYQQHKKNHVFIAAKVPSPDLSFTDVELDDEDDPDCYFCNAVMQTLYSVPCDGKFGKLIHQFLSVYENQKVKSAAELYKRMASLSQLLRQKYPAESRTCRNELSRFMKQYNATQFAIVGTDYAKVLKERNTDRFVELQSLADVKPPMQLKD